MAVKKQKSEFSATKSISVALYDNVQNGKDLKGLLMSGSINAAFLSTRLIVSEAQVMAAANRALQMDMQNRKITRTLHSEVLYSLSPTKNISDAFKKFGFGEKDASLLVVEIHDTDESTMSQLATKIQGDLVDVSTLSNFSNIEEVKKIYKVKDNELTVGTLEEALLCRMASKDFVSF